MADDTEAAEEPSFWDKTMNYVRGKASAADKTAKIKPVPIDPVKAKEIEDSFKSAK